MLAVIGFEGSARGNCVLTYGAAALTDTAFLYNCVTGTKSRIEDWDSLLKEGHVTACEEPYGPLHGGVLVLPCHVMRTRRVEYDLVAKFINAHIEPPVDKVLESWHDSNWHYYLFAGHQYINAFATKIRDDLQARAEDFRKAYGTLTSGMDLAAKNKAAKL